MGFAVNLWAAAPVAALDLTFTNKTGYSDDELFVWFQQPLNATFNDSNLPFSTATSYSLAEIGSGVDVSSFIGGRVFVSVGAPFPAQTSNIVPPQFVNPSPPAINNSYNNMHQLVGEITLTPSPGDLANLSHIDWVAMPAAMTTYAADGTQLKRIGFSENLDVAAYRDALVGLTNGGAVLQAGTNAPGNEPTATHQNGSTYVLPQSPEPGSDIRILSPTSNLLLEQMGRPTYASFENYVDHLTTTASGPIATLEGRFFSGPTPPTYHFTVDSIEAPGIDDPAWSLGQVTMTGTLSNSSQVHTIVIPFESFSDFSIYGGTTGAPVNLGGNEMRGIGYYLDGVLTDGGANTAFTLPVRDFLAGLNYGYIGSSVMNPNAPGLTYGESASQFWGGTNLITNLPQVFQAFSEVQPEDLFFNQWAEVVHDFSDGQVYGFAYDDTFAPVSIGVVQQGSTPVARLDILLLPPLATAEAVPELGSVTLIAFAAVGGFMARRKFRKAVS
jgi:hypothetical protein